MGLDYCYETAWNLSDIQLYPGIDDKRNQNRRARIKEHGACFLSAAGKGLRDVAETRQVSFCSRF